MSSFASTLSLTLTLLIAAATIQSAFSQECITNLDEIFTAESGLEDISEHRVYTLCTNTVFSVGVMSNDGFDGGSFPLVLRSNAHVMCGEDGSSANNCVIDGLGSIGIYINPRAFGFDEIRVDNITIQGVTIDSFLNPSDQQVPVFLAGDGGDVTFLDCIYSNNQAQPFFLLDQYFYVLGPFGRRLNQFKDLGNDNALRLKYGGRAIYDHFHQTNKLPVAPDLDHMELGREHRSMAADTTLTVTFQSCQFTANNNLEIPTSNHGLTMLRFRGAEAYNFGNDVLGNLNANVLNCVFQDNDNSFEGDDEAVLRSFIDFYSTGVLRLENNCFVNSPISNTPLSNIVIAQNGSTVVSVNNFIDPPQNLSCPFVTEWSLEYDGFLQCNGAVANAAECAAASEPAPGPSPTTAPLPTALATMSSRDEPITYFTRFMAIINGSGVTPNLDATAEENGASATIFVPDDEAFAEFSDLEYVEMLLTDSMWSLHAMCVASVHILRGRLPTSLFSDGRYGTTFFDEGVLVGIPDITQPNVEGVSLVDGATDIETSTGLVHYTTAPIVPYCIGATLYDFISSSSNHTILLELIGIAGLEQSLSEDSPLTVFAPIDDAFSAISDEALTALKADTAALRDLLLYHVVATNIPIADFLFPADTTTAIPTLEGSNITISNSADETGSAFYVNDAFGITLNELGSNGIIHIIDSVLTIGSDTTVPPVTMPPATGAPAGTEPSVSVAPVTVAPVMSPEGSETPAPATTAPLPAPSTPPSSVGTSIATIAGLAVSLLVTTVM